MMHTCPALPLQPDSSTMPMKSKLVALNLFCKAMLHTGRRTSDPDANLYISDEARALARRETCALAPTLRLAARSYNWIRILSQSAQPNLPLLAEAEMASLASPSETPPHLKHYEAERSSLTLQMILETVHIYTDEEVMEPDDFKLAALIISQTLYNLGMGRQTVKDIVNGAAQHLRWIFPSKSTRVLNGIHVCLFPSDVSPWPREEDTNPYETNMLLAFLTLKFTCLSERPRSTGQQSWWNPRSPRQRENGCQTTFAPANLGMSCAKTKPWNFSPMLNT